MDQTILEDNFAIILISSAGIIISNYYLVKMEKKLLIIFTILLCLSSISNTINAQVTIGSDIPPSADALLELKETDAGTSTKGLLLPRVSLSSTTLPNPLSAHTAGMTVYNTATTGDVSPGYYCNNGEKWVRLEAIEPWLVSGTADQATSNKQSIYQMGQVGIGTTSPNNSAILDLDVSTLDNDNKKGFLGPRVALESPTDQTTIPSPATGLLVYNIGTAGLKTIGYLYWAGSEWVQFTTGTSKEPEISALDCANARINPTSYKAGVPYEGVLVIPYSGGNGGFYASGTPIPSTGAVTGLTATLQPGNLAYGNGELFYTLSGTPSLSSPDLAEFDVTFAGSTCTAIVGANSLLQGQQTYWYGSMPANVYGSNNLASNHINDMPVIEDVFRMDAYFRAASNGTGGLVTLDPRMYNISSNPIKIWASSMSSQEGFGYSSITIPAGGYIQFDNGVYLSQGQVAGSTSTTANNGQETVTIDLFYNGKWFRLYYTIWVDNKETADNSDNTRELYLSIHRLY